MEVNRTLIEWCNAVYYLYTQHGERQLVKYKHDQICFMYDLPPTTVFEIAVDPINPNMIVDCPFFRIDYTSLGENKPPVVRITEK